MKQGYKLSPLGPIPEDWEVKRLGEVCTFHNGRAYNQKELLNQGKYRVLRVGNFFTNNSWYYSSLELEDDKYANDGDLLYAWSASFGPRFWKGEKVIYHYHIWKIDSFRNISNSYLYSFLFFDASKLKKNLQGGTMVHVTKENMENRWIPLPSLPEQQRIVSVLSLWDTAIAKQTALIEKLTLRKRGLMQQLLTGKKRLEGFEGGNFHRLGNYISECTRRNAGCNRVLSVTNTRGFILQEEQFDKIVASNDTSNYKVVRRGEFAYNPSRVNVGSLAMLNEYDEGILSPMYIVFKANENIDKTYLLQCLQSWWFRGHIPAYTQGSVRDSLSFDGLCSIKFYIPTLQEQKAISAILERADKEIDIQKQKLMAMQAQKKGLMQVLLTGKKRVK